MFCTKMRYPLGLRLMRVRHRMTDHFPDDTTLRPAAPLKMHRSRSLRRARQRG
jgi:hypothetical protein